MSNPPALISIDIDSLWVVAATMGHTARLDEATIYTQAVREFLRLLSEFGELATFFCVGRDMTVASNREVLLEIIERGHEIGNHTMTHPTNWQTLNDADKTREIAEADEALRQAGASVVCGFRGSGYYLDAPLLAALRKLKYSYDTSLLPSPWVSLLMKLGRLVMARSTKGNQLYARVAPWRAPQSPYFLTERNIYQPAAAGTLVELPVSVHPTTRLPFHSTFVFGSGMSWFERGLRAVRRTGQPLVYTFHAVDLLNGDADGRLRRYVTTRIPIAQRREMVRGMLQRITQDFRVLTASQLAEEFRSGSTRMPLTSVTA